MMPTLDRGPTAHGGSLRARLPAGVDLAEVAGRFGPALAGWLLPFALVLYLALKGGGYDEVIRGEVGIAVWWVVLLGALVGVLPAARIRGIGWVGPGVLIAFGVWTAIGVVMAPAPAAVLAQLDAV